MRKYIMLMALLCATAVCSGGCAAQMIPIGSDANHASAEPAQASTEARNISVGYIVLADDQEAADLYADTDASQALSKMFHGEPVSVFSVNGEWAEISYGGTQGYVKVENISFSKPEAKADKEVQKSEDIAKIPAEPAANITSSGSGSNSSSGNSGKALVDNQINNEINIVFLSDGDGFKIADPVSSYSGYVAEKSGRNAWCSAESVYIYAQPSKSSSKREANMLYYGDSLKVLGAVDGWYYISTDSGSGYDLHGYVGQSYITYGESPAPPQNASATAGRVKVKSANVRSSPSKETDNNVLFTVYEGATFDVLSYDGYWYKISYNGTTCYISHKMVEVW